jgi:regulator of replication initiation timing
MDLSEEITQNCAYPEDPSSTIANLHQQKIIDDQKVELVKQEISISLMADSIKNLMTENAHLKFEQQNMKENLKKEKKKVGDLKKKNKDQDKTIEDLKQFLTMLEAKIVC